MQAAAAPFFVSLIIVDAARAGRYGPSIETAAAARLWGEAKQFEDRRQYRCASIGTRHAPRLEIGTSDSKDLPLTK